MFLCYFSYRRYISYETSENNNTNNISEAEKDRLAQKFRAARNEIHLSTKNDLRGNPIDTVLVPHDDIEDLGTRQISYIKSGPTQTQNLDNDKISRLLNFSFSFFSYRGSDSCSSCSQTIYTHNHMA